MLPTTVDTMLKDYRSFAGRCKFLEGRMMQIQNSIEREMGKQAEEMVSIGGMNLDGMPHGTSVGNPTEKLGVMLADGVMTPFVHELIAEKEAIKEEYDEKILTVVFVEGWLKGLTERERWIVEQQVIDKVTWRELMAEYPLRFGETRTKRALQMLRDRAMEKIYEMAT